MSKNITEEARVAYARLLDERKVAPTNKREISEFFALVEETDNYRLEKVLLTNGELIQGLLMLEGNENLHLVETIQDGRHVKGAKFEPTKEAFVLIGKYNQNENYFSWVIHYYEPLFSEWKVKKVFTEVN